MSWEYSIIFIIITLLITRFLIKNEKTRTEIKSTTYILIIVLITRVFIIEPFVIPSGSMKPTLLIGDFIFVNKFIYTIKIPIIEKNINISKPKRGDVIIFKQKETYFIKRIIGLPGDKIEYKNKKLYINKIQIKHKYTGEIIKNTNSFNFEEIIDSKTIYNIYYNKNYKFNNYKHNNIEVPKFSYFVLGDNRDNSDDSRYWGFVKEKNIIGKAFIKWLSFDNIENNIRWNRILKIIK